MTPEAITSLESIDFSRALSCAKFVLLQTQEMIFTNNFISHDKYLLFLCFAIVIDNLELDEVIISKLFKREDSK